MIKIILFRVIFPTHNRYSRKSSKIRRQIRPVQVRFSYMEKLITYPYANNPPKKLPSNETMRSSSPNSAGRYPPAIEPTAISQHNQLFSRHDYCQSLNIHNKYIISVLLATSYFLIKAAKVIFSEPCLLLILSIALSIRSFFLVLPIVFHMIKKVTTDLKSSLREIPRGLFRLILLDGVCSNFAQADYNQPGIFPWWYRLQEWLSVL